MRLRNQFSLSLGALALVMGIFMMVYFPAQQKAAALQSLEQRAVTSTAIIARASAAALDFYTIDPEGGIAELQAVLQIASENPDVVYVQVFDHNGHELPSRFGVVTDAVEFSGHSRLETVTGSQMLHVKMPVWSGGENIFSGARPDAVESRGERLGAVQIGFSLQQTQQMVSREFTAILSVTAIMILGAALLALVLGKLLMRPMEALESVVHRFGQGHGAVRALTTGSNEVSRLGDAFNRMADSLAQSSRVERERHAELEVANTALTAAHDRLQLLVTAVEQTDEAIAITDRDGRFQYVNPAFEVITGYQQDEAVGRTPGELLKSGEHPEEFYRDLWTTITAGRIWTGRIRNRKKDGTIYDEMQTISPIRESGSGEITGYVAVKRDITAQLQMEEELSQARKLESIGQLAAGIAHEINTPTQYVSDNTVFLQRAFGGLMEAAQGSVQLLETIQGGPVEAEDMAKFESLLRNAKLDFLQRQVPPAFEQSLEGLDRISRIVGAMKEFSHPAQEKTNVDINRAIQSTITVASNEWKYVAEMHTELDPDLPPVFCLLGAFNQVILNIIVNAAHAIGDIVGDGGTGKGSITVTTRQVDQWAEIRIADTGAGMTEAVRARIFDAFFTTKEVGKGTGQGLAIAYNVIVEKHGGTIDVESEPGQGTCFILRLPLEPQTTEVASERRTAA